MVACATWNNAPSQRPVLEQHCRVKSFHGIHEAQDGALAEVISGTRAIRGDGADGHVVQVASRDLEEHITPHAAAQHTACCELCPATPHSALIGAAAPGVGRDCMQLLEEL